MGKPTGFMDYKREDAAAFSVEERIKLSLIHISEPTRP